MEQQTQVPREDIHQPPSCGPMGQVSVALTSSALQYWHWPAYPHLTVLRGRHTFLLGESSRFKSKASGQVTSWSTILAYDSGESDSLLRKRGTGMNGFFWLSFYNFFLASQENES